MYSRDTFSLLYFGINFMVLRGFPDALAVDSICQCRRCKRLRLDLWVGKIPWRRK